jgi:hypothetical protein
MPLFKIVTTTISYLSIDPTDEGDAEAYDDAIDSETGKVDTEALKDLLEDNGINDAHDDLDCMRDSQETTITELSKDQAKLVLESQ